MKEKTLSDSLSSTSGAPSICKDIETDLAHQLSVSANGEVEKTMYCLNTAAVGATSSVVVEMLTSDASKYGFILDYETCE